jgi:hypothetical protein
MRQKWRVEEGRISGPSYPLKERRWDRNPGRQRNRRSKLSGRSAVPRALKEVVAELTLENRLLKKSAIGAGEDGA